MLSKIKSRLEEEMYCITIGEGKPISVYEFCQQMLSFIRNMERTSVLIDGHIDMQFTDEGELHYAKLNVDQQQLRDAIQQFSPNDEVTIEICKKDE